MTTLESSMEWLEPWSPISDATIRRRLEQELRLELARSHPIFGWQATAVGRRCDCDDVLFEVGESGQFAVVHLAYAAHPDRPPWPETELFEGIDDFVERRMKPDHADYVMDAG